MRVLRPGGRGDPGSTPSRRALAAARRHLEMYSIGREVEVADVSEERAILSLIGPRSVEIAGTAALPENACEATTVGRGRVPGRRHRDRGRPDLAAAEAGRLREALLAAGAVEVCAAAAEILRDRVAASPASEPRWAPRRCRPRRASSSSAVSFTKGCYIGQETVARLHYKGRPNRHLRGLRLSAPATPGAVLRLGEKEVGQARRRRRLPRPRADRAGDPAPRGRARQRARRR